MLTYQKFLTPFRNSSTIITRRLNVVMYWMLCLHLFSVVFGADKRSLSPKRVDKRHTGRDRIVAQNHYRQLRTAILGQLITPFGTFSKLLHSIRVHIMSYVRIHEKLYFFLSQCHGKRWQLTHFASSAVRLAISSLLGVRTLLVHDKKQPIVDHMYDVTTYFMGALRLPPSPSSLGRRRRTWAHVFDCRKAACLRRPNLSVISLFSLLFIFSPFTIHRYT